MEFRGSLRHCLLFRGNRRPCGTAQYRPTHAADDVIGCHSNVLYAGASIIVHKLLNLASTTSGRRLVDWHFDRFLVVSNYDRSQGGVFRVHSLVVHRPVTMEHQHPLVPAISRIRPRQSPPISAGSILSERHSVVLIKCHHRFLCHY